LNKVFDDLNVDKEILKIMGFSGKIYTEDYSNQSENYTKLSERIF